MPIPKAIGAVYVERKGLGEYKYYQGKIIRSARTRASDVLKAKSRGVDITRLYIRARLLSASLEVSLFEKSYPGYLLASSPGSSSAFVAYYTV